jgi:hypothetical protein
MGDLGNRDRFPRRCLQTVHPAETYPKLISVSYFRGTGRCVLLEESSGARLRSASCLRESFVDNAPIGLSVRTCNAEIHGLRHSRRWYASVLPTECCIRRISTPHIAFPQSDKMAEGREDAKTLGYRGRVGSASPLHYRFPTLTSTRYQSCHGRVVSAVAARMVASRHSYCFRAGRCLGLTVILHRDRVSLDELCAPLQETPKTGRVAHQSRVQRY